MGEHGDIAFHAVKNSVPAMFAKKQFGGKSRSIVRSPHRKRHREATCVARVDESVSAAISTPKTTKNQQTFDLSPANVLQGSAQANSKRTQTAKHIETLARWRAVCEPAALETGNLKK